MEEININFLKIKWIEHTYKASKIFNCPLMTRELRKPFHLGETKNNIFNKYLSVSYIISKVMTTYESYEIMESGKIRVTYFYSKESKEISENLTFKANWATKIVFPKTIEDETLIFGFENIEKGMALHFNKIGFSMIGLFGPDGSGKKMFLKKLERDYEEKQFLWIDQEKLIEEKGAFQEIVYYIETYQTRLVLCVIDKHRIENDLLHDTNLYDNIKKFKKDKYMDLKVIITSVDEKLVSPIIMSIIEERIIVKHISTYDRIKLLKHVLQDCGDDDKTLSLINQSLNGYSAADVVILVDHVVKTNEGHLSFEKLIEGIEEKVYQPLQLKNCVAKFDKLKWSDIGGYEQVKKVLREEVQDMLLSKDGLGRVAKGIILHGPPGCSKTMFARALATECRLNMFCLKPSDINRSLLGDSETILRNILQLATSCAPSLVFMDEIDTLLSNRDGHGDSAVGNRLIAELFIFLDNAETNKDHQVILMAATNRIDKIDSAFIDSGRFDLVIKVDLPDQISRESILRIIFSDNQFTFEDRVNDNVPQLAKVLNGKSGSDIVMMGKEVKKLSKDIFDKGCGKGVPHVTMEQVEKVFGLWCDHLSEYLENMSI